MTELLCFAPQGAAGEINLFDFHDQDALQYALRQAPGEAWVVQGECAAVPDHALGVDGALATSSCVPQGTPLDLMPALLQTDEPQLPRCAGLAHRFGELLDRTAAALPHEDCVLAHAYRWHLAQHLPSSATLQDALAIDTYLPILLLFCLQQLPADEKDALLERLVQQRVRELA